MRKLTRDQVHSIAGRLLDDMCANMMLIESFSLYDVDQVAQSLGEMLEDENHADLAPQPKRRQAGRKPARRGGAVRSERARAEGEAMRKSGVHDGSCCACGYNGDEETPCPKREDGSHCEHWWDGPVDEDRARSKLGTAPS